MSQPSRSPAELFEDLRDQLFRSDLSTLAPAAPGEVSDPGHEVIGAAMELAFEGGSCLVFGLRDGSASLYLSTGGGSIGGQGRPHINRAAKGLVQVAREFVTSLPAVTEYPLPTSGRVRFSIFTSSGVHGADADEADLMSGRGALLPLFTAAHEIITGFRLVEEPEPNDEPSYLNCLLTTLARGKTTSVTLREGTTPPDPATLTEDTDDLTWIKELGFALDRLSCAKIIGVTLQLAGFRWFSWGKTEGRIQARVVSHGGEDSSHAAFKVLRRRREGRIEVEIAVQTVGRK